MTPPSAEDALAAQVSVEQLDRKHEWFQANAIDWANFELLYQGGMECQRRIQTFLAKRPRELAEVYNARCAKSLYQNVLGSVIDYYLASLFQNPPEIGFVEPTEDGSVQAIDPAPEVKGFYSNLQKNCDRKGTSLLEFFREVLRQLLLFQSAWILVDLPKPDREVATLGEQRAAGYLDPYLVGYTPAQAINWEEGEDGLEWVVFKTEGICHRFLQEPLKMAHWFYFDRQTFRVYRQEHKSDGSNASKHAELVANGPHALADLNKVPVFRVTIPKGLWLANRIALQVLAHLNQDNSYDWALFIANLAMPVLIGDGEINPVLSEAGFLRLPEGMQLLWTEPPGNSYARSEMRIASLREEIYRASYLMAQGRSAEASPAVQSGYSKELDMVPAGHIQNMLGDVLKSKMQEVLDTVAHVRGDSVNFDVRGFTFLESPAAYEIQLAQSYSTMRIPSRTAEVENMLKVVRARFRDVNPETLEQIVTEVREAPTPSEQEAAQQQAQEEAYSQRFASAADRAGMKTGEGKSGEMADEAAAESN